MNKSNVVKIFFLSCCCFAQLLTSITEGSAEAADEAVMAEMEPMQMEAQAGAVTEHEAAMITETAQEQLPTTEVLCYCS